MRKWSIGILKVNHFTKAHSRNKVVIEEEVGCGGAGEKYERCAEEEYGT